MGFHNIVGSDWAIHALSENCKFYAILRPAKKIMQGDDLQKVIHEIAIVELDDDKNGVPNPMSLIEKLNRKAYLSLFSDDKEKQDFSFVK